MKYIKGFDGLRAFSIILVVFTHLGFWSSISANEFILILVSILNGSTGVYIFFSISGFLITTILLKEKEKKGFVTIKNFYIRRFLRLLPAIIIFYFVLEMIMILGYLPLNNIAMLFSISYLYNFVPAKFYIGELGHTWSLGVEEQFYILWPFIIHFFSKNTVIIISSILLLSCLVLPHFFYLIHFNHNMKDFTLQKVFWDTNRFYIPAIGPIMLGAIIGCLNYSTKIFNIISKKKFFLLIAIIIFCSQLYLPNFILIIIPQNILKGFATSLILVYIYNNQEGILAKSLEFKPISYIGKISYGIYVWQGLFLRTGPGGGLIIQKFPLNIFLTFIFAVVSYEFIEKSVLKLKQKYT